MGVPLYCYFLLIINHQESRKLTQKHTLMNAHKIPYERSHWYKYSLWAIIWILMSDHIMKNISYERSQYLLWAVIRFSLFQISTRDGSTLYCCFLLIINYQESIKLIKKHPLWALIKSFMSDHTMKNISYDRSQYLLWPLIRFLLFHFLSRSNLPPIYSHFTLKNWLHIIQKNEEKHPLWAVTTHDPSQHTICICLYKPYGVIMYRYV